MTTVITLAQLREAGACKSQLDLFKKRFGESVRVTEELAIQYGPEFDTEWAAMNLLSPSVYDEYVAALAPVRATRDAAVDSIYAKFVSTRNSIYDAYTAAAEAADDAHDTAVASADAIYETAGASAEAKATHSAALDDAEAAHDAALASAYAAQAAALASIVAARNAALVPARVPYAAVSAMAFVRAYLSDC
jgi:hypothetical protein